MKLQTAIKSNTSAMWLTIIAAALLRITHAAGVAFYISWSIVFFTMKGKQKIANGFAFFEMFISICYYWLRIMWNDAGEFEMNFYIIPALSFAIVMPWSLKFYAGMVGDDHQEIKGPEKINIHIKDTKDKTIDSDHLNDINVYHSIGQPYSDSDILKFQRDVAIDLNDKNQAKIDELLQEKEAILKSSFDQFKDQEGQIRELTQVSADTVKELNDMTDVRNRLASELSILRNKLKRYEPLAEEPEEDDQWSKGAVKKS